MALVACVLWLAGFEILPWLHIATHDHVGKHHHDASGATIFDEESDAGHDHEHEHHHHHDDDDHDAAIDEHAADLAETDDHDNDDDEEDAEVDEHGQPVAHSHDHHHEHRDPLSDSEKTLRDALGHGRHSLAHHDVATTAPPPILTTPIPVDRRAVFIFADTAIEPYSFSPGRAVARGPPLATFES